MHTLQSEKMHALHSSKVRGSNGDDAELSGSPEEYRNDGAKLSQACASLKLPIKRHCSPSEMGGGLTEKEDLL
jgi:hypothetical protein